MGRKPLITLFAILIVFSLVHIFFRDALRGNVFLYQALSILYLWMPGVVALIFARIENVKFPIFAKPNRFFWQIPAVTLGICLFGFLVSIPFGSARTPSQIFINQPMWTSVGYAILILFTSYGFATLFFGVIIFGGELFYRGYLLEKWKKMGFLKATYLIALVWTLYQIPINIFAYSPGFKNLMLNVLLTFVLNFILAPVLMYYRVRGKSVLTAAFFYSSLIGALLYFVVLFPISDTNILAAYAGCTFVGLILYSFFRRIYSIRL